MRIDGDLIREIDLLPHFSRRDIARSEGLRWMSFGALTRPVDGRTVGRRTASTLHVWLNRRHLLLRGREAACSEAAAFARAGELAVPLGRF